MKEQQPDELHLSGALQINVAAEALEAVGVNQRALGMLDAMRRVHELGTSYEAQNDLSLYLKGEMAAAMKADITVGAMVMERDQTLPPEARAAASELLAVLGVERA